MWSVIAQWLKKAAIEHGKLDVELVDLANFGLPLLDEAAHPMAPTSRPSAGTRAWPPHQRLDRVYEGRRDEVVVFRRDEGKCIHFPQFIGKDRVFRPNEQMKDGVYRDHGALRWLERAIGAAEALAVLGHQGLDVITAIRVNPISEP